MSNIRKLKKIAEYILDYPLESEVNISFFEPIICDVFKEQENYVDDLLSDTQFSDFKTLKQILKNTEGRYNYLHDNYLYLSIIPSSKSKYAAKNNAPEFEQKCIELLDSLNEGDKGRKFEKIVQYLLKNIDIITDTTQTTGDNGIDLIGKGNIIEPFGIIPTYFIQCKYYSNTPDVNLPKKVAADVVYNLFEENTNVIHPIIPIIICNQKPTHSILDFSKKHGIRYIHFSELVKFCSENTSLNFEKMIKIINS